MRSPTTRLSALALAAIVAPVTIVVILGYVSLRQWESSAELLFREQARDVATMAAEKVEMMLRLAEDAFLDRLQAQLAAGDVAEPALDRIVADSRLVRRLYVFERDGSLLYPRAWRDPADAVLFGDTLRARTRAVWERGGKREVAGRRPGVPGRPPAAGARARARRLRAGRRGPAPRHSRDVAGRAGVADDRGRARSAMGARSMRGASPRPRRAGAGRAVARGAAELARGGLRAAGRLAARRGAAPGHALHRRLRGAGGRHRRRRGAHVCGSPGARPRWRS